MKSSIKKIGSSLLLIIVFTAWVQTCSASFKRVISSVSNGDWTNSSTWIGGMVPAGDDSVIISNSVSFNTSFIIGISGFGSMYITTGGTLSGANQLSLQAGVSLRNDGTLSVQALNFYSVTNDPATTFTNTGTAGFGSSVNIWSNTVSVLNSGSITITGDLQGSGTFTNTGTVVLSGGIMASTGGVISNSGTITVSGMFQLNGASFTNTTRASSIHINGQLSINSAPASTINNLGSITIGAVLSPGSFTILNSGYIGNGLTGRITLYGDLTINVGSGSNELNNSGVFRINGSLTAYGPSIILNYDSIIISGNMRNDANFTNEPNAYVGIGQNFTNVWEPNAVFNNMGGYVYVGGDFTNDYGMTYEGTGGGIVIMNITTNHGIVSGSTDVCDHSYTGSMFDYNNGTIDPSVTQCTFSPLPVELIKFTAKYGNGFALLEWTTASEINNNYFGIERSADGQNWETIGQVPGHGNSQVLESYAFNDDLQGIIPTGIIYYRLKQVDYNGKFQYSIIRSITLSQAQETFTIYPNPASNSLNINWTNQANVGTILNLIDARGAVIESEKENGTGPMQKQLDLSAYPSGFYNIQLISGDKGIMNRTFLKE